MDIQIEKDIAAFSRIEAVKMILETLQTLTGMRLSIVVRIDADSWTACAVLDRVDFGLNPGDQLELSTTYCNTANQMSSPLIVKHASRSELYKNHPGYTIYGIESYFSVPLFRQSGELFGVMCVLDPEPTNFSEDLVGTFKLLANLVTYELEAEERRQEGAELLKLTEQSNDARARFMGILGHDLRSPLNTIIAAATVQQIGRLTPEKNAELSGKIVKTARRMQFLIEDLLDTTQGLQGGEIFVDLKPADLREILQQIIDEFAISHPDRLIEFKAADDCSGHWDNRRIGQVLSNLLSNALHYGDLQLPIKVSLVKDGGSIVLRVNNQGESMSEEVLKNLFTPFWRGAKKSAKNINSSGLGLGLYIVKQIVEAHGGTIGVESDPDTGTTFTVTFETVENEA